MTRRELLDYEIQSSRWAGLISWNWLQDMAARYFARKVNTKYARWQRRQNASQWLRYLQAARVINAAEKGAEREK